MPIKSVKMKMSKNKKMRFFLMSQGSLNPRIRFLGQKLWSVARVQRDRHGQTWKWLLRAPFQGFRIFSFNLSSRIGPKKRRKTTTGVCQSNFICPHRLHLMFYMTGSNLRHVKKMCFFSAFDYLIFGYFRIFHTSPHITLFAMLATDHNYLLRNRIAGWDHIKVLKYPKIF